VAEAPGTTPFALQLCDVCGSMLYLTELLEEPDRDEWLIDFDAWTCLVCEEDGGYMFDPADHERFRAHIDLLREQARHSSDPDVVAQREMRRWQHDEELDRGSGE
jgi:hypothetical protein